MDLASSALGWLSLLCAVGALAVYAYMVSRQPRMIRLFNGLGLFLTGLALFQGPAILRETGPGTNVFIAILLLNLAVITQAYAVLRNRTAWDGVDRRNAPGGANT